MLHQLKTHTQAYWQNEFTTSHEDLEFVYSLLIETGAPLTTTQIAQALIEQRLDSEINQIRANLRRGKAYQPKGVYKVGDGLVFPSLDVSFGTVVGARPGYNPEYSDFTVIEVHLEGESATREFASGLTAAHKLNFGDSPESVLADLVSMSSEEVFASYGPLIEQRLATNLQNAHSLDFVQFGNLWYLKGLLADVHIGHRNVVEAILDVNGAPLAPEAILEQVDLPPEISATAQLFSMNYALQQDERFDDVGTDEQVLWSLRRLQPPEAQFPPRRLLASLDSYDRSVLTEDLLRLERELDDELSRIEWTRSEVLDLHTASLLLTYPHFRTGTLPLTNRMKQIFPKGSTQHTRVTLIDGQSGDQIPGWVSHTHGYVCGLDGWYANNNLMVGSYITLEKTDDPFKVLINYIPKREKREWIRVAKSDGSKLLFEMKKQPCKCEYDELLVVGEDGTKEIDGLWIRSEVDGIAIAAILRDVFLELAKLSPQGTVHAKTLYSAANVVRRCPPGLVFAALAENPSFEPVGDGYWLYNEA